MKTRLIVSIQLVALVFADEGFSIQRDHTQRPSVIRVPNGGVQPEVAVDTTAIVHMVYFKGEPGHGDVFYVRSKDWGMTFSSPMRVNSEPGTAVATGTIRGAHLALGKNGRVHVVWNGSAQSSLRGPRIPEMPSASPYNGLPMLYTRLNDAGTAFERERNLMKATFGLDGGGSVAADGSGNVYVAWHGKRNGDPEGEGGRQVWIARSRNEGKDFSPEYKAYNEPTGACGCCGLSIFADGDGSVYVLYRTATEMVHRDVYLLVSKDAGETFTGRRVDKWNIEACPMTSMAFAKAPVGLLAAWQTEEQVYYAPIDPTTSRTSEPIPATGSGKVRKYPTVAVDAKGQTMLVWTEGTSWGKGGSLAWQVYSIDGEPTEEKGSVPDLPAWSFGAVFARPAGGFTIAY